MPIELVNPAGLPDVAVYRQVAVATGTKTAFVAGQVAVTADGTVVPGDLGAQAAQCYANVQTALAGVGGTFDDVARLTVYVVGWTPDQMPMLMDGIETARAAHVITASPPITLIGVAALAAPEYLIEVEATAVLA